MDSGAGLPVWKAKQNNRIDLPDLCYMHGGPEGMHLPEHEHSEVQLEMHFLASGAGGDRVLADPPSFLKLVPSGKPHIGRWEDGNEVVVVLLGQEYMARAKEEVLSNSSATIIDTECAVDPVLQAIGTAIRREFLTGGVADELYLEALGTVLSGHLVRRWSRHSAVHRHGGRLSPAQLRRTIETMEDGRKKTIASLADEIGLGSHQFTRLFRRTTGHSPYQFLVQRRLAKACALLESTHLSLAEIALQVGFASQSHFTSVFQRHYRSTPLKFRRERQRT